MKALLTATILPLIASLSPAQALNARGLAEVRKSLEQGTGTVERQYQSILQEAAAKKYSVERFSCALEAKELICKMHIEGLTPMEDGRKGLHMLDYEIQGTWNGRPNGAEIRFRSLSKVREQILPPLGGRSSTGG